ncbi:MAG: hypothetical protein OXU20_30950 [Myxococcales bacterium]|nr:hypothetical protein [Myxococcales bacterium]MDD9971017.1 hypothetical protein [Myxococcales bacterium]
MAEPVEPTWFAVVPPLFAIALALILRRVVIALSAGVLVAALVMAQFHPVAGFLRAAAYVWGAFEDGGHRWILSFAVLLGGLMRLLRSSGGARGLATRIARVARTRRSGQMTAWVLGLVFFFDDYANTLMVGSTMGPVARRLRISREKLAFIVDATAAPVASLAPISSWIAVEIGYIADQLQALALPGDAYAVFLATLPTRFYPIFMLGLGVMIALSGRDFGPMARAERAVLVDPPEAEEAVSGERSTGVGERPATGSLWISAFPLLLVLLTVVFGLYYTGRAGALSAGLPLTLENILTNASSSKAMVFASLAGGAAALVATARTGRLGWAAAASEWGRGALGMVPVMAVLLLAWALGAACKDLQTARYLVGILGAGFDAGLLPAVVFLVSALVSFATGTSWGTMGIIFPLATPLAFELAPDDRALLLTTLSSVLAGSVFGDHCSPISDTTIMSALATGCEQVAHVRTQLPYAVLAATVALACGSVPVGLGLFSAWLAIPLGLTATYLALRVISARGSPSAAPLAQVQK